MKVSAIRSSNNSLDMAAARARVPLIKPALLALIVVLVTGMAVAQSPVPSIMQTTPNSAAPAGAEPRPSVQACRFPHCPGLGHACVSSVVRIA